MKIEEELKKILSQVLDISIDKVNDSLSRNTTEDWDSFNHLLIISQIEKQTGINFTTAEVEKIKSLKDIKEIFVGKNK